METVEAALAVIGVVGLIGTTIRWCGRHLPEPPLEEDIAAPYREGLHAAIRMQVVAQDLKQQIHAEAIRHAKGGPGGES